MGDWGIYGIIFFYRNNKEGGKKWDIGCFIFVSILFSRLGLIFYFIYFSNLYLLEFFYDFYFVKNKFICY